MRSQGRARLHCAASAAAKYEIDARPTMVAIGIAMCAYVNRSLALRRG